CRTGKAWSGWRVDRSPAAACSAGGRTGEAWSGWRVDRSPAAACSAGCRTGEAWSGWRVDRSPAAACGGQGLSNQAHWPSAHLGIGLRFALELRHNQDRIDTLNLTSLICCKYLCWTATKSPAIKPHLEE